MEPKARAAGSLLRRFGVAMKTHVLYPPPNPVADKTTTDLLEELRGYTEAYGPFAARVSKHAFIVDGVALKDGAISHLAFHLYTRKIMHLTILPAASHAELTTCLSLLGKDRRALEADGGVGHLLWQAGVESVKVAEMAFEQTGVLQAQASSELADLLVHEWLAPDDRERLMDLLRAGPQEVRALLLSAPDAPDDSREGGDQRQQAEQVYQVLRNLDRLILDEPFEDQPQLYANLTAALALLEEPLQAVLAGTLAARAEDDPTATVVLDQLAKHRLTRLIPGGVLPTRRPGAQADVPPRLPGDIRGLMPRDGASSTPGPPEYRLSEAGSTDEAAVMREAVATLVDVLRSEEDERDMQDIAGVLEGYLPWLVDHQEFGFLQKVLGGIRDAASGPSGTLKQSAARLLKNVADGPLLASLLEALWRGRDTDPEKEVRACLEVLREWLVSPLMHVLTMEPRAGVRAMVCDLIVSVGRDRVDDIASHATHERWYLARNAANILGRLGGPQAVAHLARLAGHPEYRVRREVLDALLRIGTPEAEVHLAMYLDDPDEQLRMRVLETLSEAGVRQVLPKLLGLLDRRDLWNRHFEIRQQVIATLARTRVHEALPSLRRIARRRFLFDRRGRALRRLAHDAIATIDGQEPSPGSRLLLVGKNEGNRP